VVAGLT